MADYWGERAAKAQETLTDKSIAETNKQLVKYYGSTMEEVLGQFETTYNKLLLTIGEGRTPTPADLYKLDKYWQTQAQLKRMLEQLGDRQYTLLSQNFVSQYQGIYEALALLDGGMFSTIDERTAQTMINHIWCADGKSWSERIWDNTALLQQALNDDLIDCVVAGKPTSDLKKRLINDFNVSYNRADALVRTELAHIQTQAAQQRYLDMGITEVEVLVGKDERTCPVCKEYIGKRYPALGKMPVPAHPRCRCCVIPVVD